VNGNKLMIHKIEHVRAYVDCKLEPAFQGQSLNAPLRDRCKQRRSEAPPVYTVFE
jgi:hypothetical protein